MNNQPEIKLSSSLQTKLEGFQKRVWKIKILEGLFSGLFGLILSWVLLFFLDRIIDTPNWLRLALFIGGVFGLGLLFPLKLHSWVWSKKSLASVAKLIKITFPRLGDELLGVIELVKTQDEKQHSQKLASAAVNQVSTKIEKEDFTEAVPNPKHKKIGYLAVGATVCLLGVLFFSSKALVNTLHRWVFPLVEIQRFTFTQLAGLKDEYVIPAGEEYKLPINLSEETEWKPEKAEVKFTDRIPIEAKRANDQYVIPILPRNNKTDIKLKIGDAREKISIRPETRPEMVEIEASIQLPDYLAYGEPVEIKSGSSKFQILKGSDITIKTRTSRQLESVYAEHIKIDKNGDQFELEKITLEQPQQIKINWKDVYQLEPKSPMQLELTPVDDQTPEIYSEKNTGEKIILETETVTFDLRVLDDYGIKEVGLEWKEILSASAKGEGQFGEKIVYTGSPKEKDIKITSKEEKDRAVATFQAKREGVKPQSLNLKAYAIDYLPGRERAYSSNYVLHILSEFDHEIWVNEQFRKWIKAVQEVQDKESKLLQKNQELRNLTDEEIVKQENRKKLIEQADAEKKNAKQLERVSKAGKEIVKQAIKNENFEAEKLEKLAAIMKKLDELSENKMPSVADLLKKASKAPKTSKTSKESDQKSKQGKDLQPPPKVGEEQNNKEQQPTKDKKEEDAQGPEKKAPKLETSVEGYLEEMEKEKTESSEGKGALELPNTTLQADPNQKDKEKNSVQTAKKQTDKAVNEQQKILDEFSELTEEFKKLLGNLESSTFVRRLKSASKKQIELSSRMNRFAKNRFGVEAKDYEPNEVDTLKKLSKKHSDESNKIKILLSDLRAYLLRRDKLVIRELINKIQGDRAVEEINTLGELGLKSFSGTSISSSEFWADTLDRWAEELISNPGEQESQKGQSGEKGSLPPKIVLQVMKALQQEMELRDATRELEQSKKSLETKKYNKRAKSLSDNQGAIEGMVRLAVTDIQDLENPQQFGKEIKLLTAVAKIMNEAESILSEPDTGLKAVGAETEAIELLLQTNRNKGGGGGGGSGDGQSPPKSNQSNLERLLLAQSQNEKNTKRPEREVNQSIGKTGKKVPPEFRNGLDDFFQNMEAR